MRFAVVRVPNLTNDSTCHITLPWSAPLVLNEHIYKQLLKLPPVSQEPAHFVRPSSDRWHVHIHPGARMSHALQTRSLRVGLHTATSACLPRKS